MKYETKWSLIISLLAFLLFNVEMLLGLHEPEMFDNWQIADPLLSLAIFLFGYWMMFRQKRDLQLGGHMSWRKGFWTGAIATLLLIPPSTLLVYVFITWINPMFPLVFAEKTGQYDYMRDSVGLFLTGHVLSTMLVGLLLSVILPFFLRKSHK